MKSLKPSTKLFMQFIRFGLVGFVATLSHMGTLIFLVEKLDLTPIPASTVGFTLAVVISYLLNFRWTFDAKGNHKIYFPKYAVVCLTGFALNTGIMFLTVNVLGWWYIAGQVSVLAIVPLTNFILNRLWAFKDDLRVSNVEKNE